METPTSLVIEGSIDTELLETIHGLRQIRIEVLYKQLENIDWVIESLPIESTAGTSRSKLKDDIREHIRMQVKKMEKRIKEQHTVYDDELELFTNLIKKD